LPPLPAALANRVSRLEQRLADSLTPPEARISPVVIYDVADGVPERPEGLSDDACWFAIPANHRDEAEELIDLGEAVPDDATAATASGRAVVTPKPTDAANEAPEPAAEVVTEKEPPWRRIVF
jgi:hypothetical protein